MALATGTTLFANADPTTSYVASSWIKVCDSKQVTVQFKYTYNSSTAIVYYYEWSPDAVTWYTAVNIATTAGANTVTQPINTIAVSASVNWEDAFYVQDVFLRVQVKRTGGAVSDTIAITATLLRI